MPTSPLNVVLQHLLADLRPEEDGMTDEELMARFVRSRDEAALAALVQRHAPMVWGVCRRTLRSHHDAEDAFQATFLVLVRKAADVPRQAVANWLYGVARQTAVRVRAAAAKQGRRETQVVSMPEPTVAECRESDSQGVLDEELSRLPDHYRAVLILCELEGMTRKEAARQLGIPEGSVASRLARAREMLTRRLTQRGIVFSGGSVAAGSAVASATPALVASTIKAATLIAAGTAAAKVVPATVAALTDGVLKAMFMTKIKCVMGAVLLVAALVSGAGLIHATKDEDQPSRNTQSKQEEGQASKRVASDRARTTGTMQFRITGPEGMKVAIWTGAGGEGKVAPIEVPGRLNLEQGKRSRLKLSGIPNRPGVELYPVVEVAEVETDAEAFVSNSAVPVEFTDEDFDAVAGGGVTTKVVFLEGGRASTAVSRNGTEKNPVEEAKRRGVILAVVRLGNIDLLGKASSTR